MLISTILPLSPDHIRTGDNYAGKLADDSITHEQIASHTLTNSSLASGIIVSKFADEILFAEQLGTIDNSKLAADAVLANHIKKYSLKAANFDSDSFQSNEFANNSIVSPNLADDVIVLADMNDDVIRTEHIKGASLLDEDFEGSIEFKVKAAGVLTGGEFVDEFLDGSNVSSNSLTEGKFANLSLDSREIKSNQIINRHFANNTLTNLDKFEFFCCGCSRH